MGKVLGNSKRMLLALVLIGGGLAYLISTAVSDSTMYYFTVEEALAKGTDATSALMRVSGDIVGDSIDWSPREMRLSFAVQGETGTRLQAVYFGPRPDNFEPGTQAILEGRFDEQGVFRVEKLMLACPSRFTPEDKAAGTGGENAAARA